MKIHNIICTVLLVIALSACTTARRSKTPLDISITPSPYTITTDTSAHANIDMTIRVGQGTIGKRSRLFITPQLTMGDSVVSELTPLVLDGPIYTRKLHRRAVLSHYRDAYAGTAHHIANVQTTISLPYHDSIVLPMGIDTAHIVAVLSTDGCGSCTGFGSIEMGTIVRMQTPKREKPQLSLLPSHFTVKPKILHGRGEAHLQFVINRDDILLSMGNNAAELDSMMSRLSPIINDTLSTINSLSIYGMASADGPLPFNTDLARRRATSACRWIVEQMGIPSYIERRIVIGSRPEGWQPVLEAMTIDGCKDSIAVKNILQRYATQNDDVQERYIRRLPCWPLIRDRYLQKDRKVEYAYTYTLRSFSTDDELRSMYLTRPDAFSETELLRCAELQPDMKQAISVYRYTLSRYPASHIAANNLAYLLFATGRDDEAFAIVDKYLLPTTTTEGGTR